MAGKIPLAPHGQPPMIEQKLVGKPPQDPVMIALNGERIRIRYTGILPAQSV